MRHLPIDGQDFFPYSSSHDELWTGKLVVVVVVVVVDHHYHTDVPPLPHISERQSSRQRGGMDRDDTGRWDEEGEWSSSSRSCSYHVYMYLKMKLAFDLNDK